MSKKIESYEVIGKLTKLINLEIEYGPTIENLNFLDKFKHLKTTQVEFTLIKEGNLNRFMNYQRSFVYPIKKRYFITENGNHKKPNMYTFSGGMKVYGDENIELWRRIYSV